MTPDAPIAAHGMSLEQIYAEHVDFVWNVLRACGVRDADLDDLTQEVFLVVHRKLATFEGRSKITTWLFSIAERVAGNHRRSARYRHERVMPAPPEPTLDVDASSRYEEIRARETFDAILDEMPQEQRLAFVLFEIAEYSAGEIAAVVNAPVNTVYSRLRLARLQFENSVARRQEREPR